MSKELKIGFVGILAITVLFVGVYYLKGLNVFNGSRNFYAKYENIGGLKVGNSVLLNGYEVGMVSDINIKIVFSGRPAMKANVNIQKRKI